MPEEKGQTRRLTQILDVSFKVPNIRLCSPKLHFRTDQPAPVEKYTENLPDDESRLPDLYRNFQPKWEAQSHASLLISLATTSFSSCFIVLGEDYSNEKWFHTLVLGSPKIGLASSSKGYFGFVLLLLLSVCLSNVQSSVPVPPSPSWSGVGVRKTKDLFPAIHSLTLSGNRVNPLASWPTYYRKEDGGQASPETSQN